MKTRERDSSSVAKSVGGEPEAAKRDLKEGAAANGNPANMEMKRKDGIQSDRLESKKGKEKKSVGDNVNGGRTKGKHTIVGKCDNEGEKIEVAEKSRHEEEEEEEGNEEEGKEEENLKKIIREEMEGVGGEEMNWDEPPPPPLFPRYNEMTDDDDDDVLEGEDGGAREEREMEEREQEERKIALIQQRSRRMKREWEGHVREKKYLKMLRSREALPAMAMREEILQQIQSNQVPRVIELIDRPLQHFFIFFSLIE